MIGFLLLIRFKDLPKPAPVSPFRHLDERKAAIYESLRDLQFEYRLNKLSDQDYQTTKIELQKELARVLAEDRSHQSRDGQRPSEPLPRPRRRQRQNAMPAQVAERNSTKTLKFCGECGKPMGAPNENWRSSAIPCLHSPHSPSAAVDGMVTNSTTGKPQAGATVTLFQPTEQGPQFIDSVKTDAQGKFQITKEVPAGGAGPLLLQAVYGGVQYNKMLPPGTPTTGVEIPVFESSKSPATPRSTST